MIIRGDLALEIYREVSQVSGDRKIYMHIALLAIVALFAWEVLRLLDGHPSMQGLAFCFVLLGLWIWRCVYSYTYILTDTEFIVLSHGFGMTRKYSAKLADTESYTNKYVKSFFKRTKLRHYVHRYSSVDGNPLRLIVFNQNGSLRGVLFKSSDKMLSELKKMMADRFLPLE